MEESGRALLFLAPPILGLAIFALGRLFPRRGLEISLLLAVCAGLAGMNLLFQQDRRSNESIAAVDIPRQTDPAPAIDAQSGPLRGYDRWTAVYDISAHRVYLPNGRQLEAHSGLGSRLDDPRYVHERMRGATPPNVYELAPREKPFHGVRALRLKPMDRDRVFGRTGLLAHTYMLGPKGDSNGCVVFKDYDAFLRAFDAGELRRLAVVARLDAESVKTPVAMPAFEQGHDEIASRAAGSSLTR